MKELQKLIRAHGMSPAPVTDGDDMVIIKCHIGFEQHSYENWDAHWYLELPWCYHYWHSTTGWRRGKNELPMTFQGKSGGEVVVSAIQFLEGFLKSSVRLGTEEMRRPLELRRGKKDI